MPASSKCSKSKHEDEDTFLEESYLGTAEFVFAYPKHPKYVFIQDAPYMECDIFFALHVRSSRPVGSRSILRRGLMMRNPICIILHATENNAV